MVSFWPWKGDNNSAASFEKTLSSLASKISKASSRNESIKQQARRAKVWWTLYGGFAYILIFLILTLVTGWQNWGPYEYTVVAGGPILLYGIRVGLVAFFNWRTTSSQDQLDNLYKERDKTIEKLKAATKYNSTQDLLDKYGSPKPSPKQGAAGDGKKGSPRGQKPGGGEQRIYRMPPPTANIPRNQPQGPNSPSSPQQPLSAQSDGAYPPPNSIPPPPTPATPQQTSPNAEFAPNAFSDAPPQYAPNTGFGQSRWYDRMMDALLGEDETQAKNRIALICQQCRLVNGQAPPGTKSLEELGRWRCSACGAWNGVESETSRLVQQLADHNIANDDGQVSPDSPKSPDDVIKEDVEDDYAIANPSGGSSDRPTRVTNASLALDKQLEQDGEGSEDDEPRDARDDVDTPAKSTRSRRGGKKK